MNESEKRERVRQARERFIKETDDRWAETIWELSQELGVSEEEIEHLGEHL